MAGHLSSGRVEALAGNGSAGWSAGHRAVMPTLADLPDSASMLVRTCQPGLTPDQGRLLVHGLDLLFAQFIKEKRCLSHAAETTADGHLVLAAWVGAPLSGCSHDRLAGLFTVWGDRFGCDLLTAPPLVIAQAGQARTVDRRALRELASTADVRAATTWDTRAQTLGAWRAGCAQPLMGSWIDRALGLSSQENLDAARR